MSLERPERLLIAAAALWLAGCSPSTPSGEAPATAEGTAAATAAEPAPTAPAAPDLGATLVANTWQLDTANDASGQSIAAFFPGPENLLGLEFRDGRAAVTGGCNRISAGYQVVESTRLQLSPGMSTMMACPPPLAAADAAMSKFLTGTLQAELQGEATAPVLRLTAGDGTVLAFKGQPTPETRFGGPGARAFLEVSAQACPAPAEPTCLMVRDRFFDEQGLQTGTPGEYRPLPAGIEGFTPAAGHEHVVRVKRFETPGQTPAEHFVFDMVVESRTVK
jgi:heat shock protein HslJ